MDNILRKKLPLNIDPQAKEIIDALSLSGNVILQGSQRLQSQLYAGDYDLYEVVKGDYSSPEVATKKFVVKLQDLIKRLLKIKDTYIGDIKAGEKNGEPVRWKPNDILKGEKDGVSLAEAINTPALVKVDVISWISGRYTDFSIIYEFRNKTKVLNPVDRGTPKESLTESYKEEVRAGNYFKALKRQFSLAVLDKKEKRAEALSDIFNSDLGRLYSLSSDMKTLLYLFENYSTIPKDKVEYELEQIRVRMGYLSSLPQVNDKDILERIERLESASHDTVERELTGIIELFDKKLNRQAKKFL